MLKNPYTSRPIDIKMGDSVVYVVKAMLTYEGTVRVYRCPWREDFEPQGERMDDNAGNVVAGRLFPILHYVEDVQDTLTCNYRQDDGVYESGCGIILYNYDEDSDWTFCPHCGKPIRREVSA